MQEFETVIGLEVHVQLNTRSKIFCADPTAFGGPPNTQVSAVSLAYPGTLPNLNAEAVRKAVLLGLALGCDIQKHTSFDRKNYFYADLPKGYQITQDRSPIGVGGQLQVRLSDGSSKAIRLHHIHLEEDAGKSIHDQDEQYSWIDLNRAGVPLVEIVTEPDLRSAEEAAQFLETLRRLVRWLDVSDGNMEQGSLRCDVNISVRRIGEKKLGQRCEVKNINSMRFARRAIEFEAIRQKDIISRGGTVGRETRGFDPHTGSTFSQRQKEEAHDYRYFPDPDLPPLQLSDAFVAQLQAQLPVLPHELEATFTRQYQLPWQDVQQLTDDRPTAIFSQQVLAALPLSLAKPAANLIVQKLKVWAAEQQKTLPEVPIEVEKIRNYLELIENGQVSATAAHQQLLPVWLNNLHRMPDQLAAELEILQNNDAIWVAALVEDVLSAWPDKVAEFQRGKKGLLGLFVGEVMKKSKGKADPKMVNQLIISCLNKEKK